MATAKLLNPRRTHVLPENALADAREWARTIRGLLAHGDVDGARDRAERAIRCAEAGLPRAKGRVAIDLADFTWYAEMDSPLGKTSLLAIAGLAD